MSGIITNGFQGLKYLRKRYPNTINMTRTIKPITPIKYQLRFKETMHDYRNFDEVDTLDEIAHDYYSDDWFLNEEALVKFILGS